MTEQTVTNSTVKNATSKKSPFALWMLMLTFAVPIVAAYTYFFFGDRDSTSNHGDFIVPVIDIEALRLQDKENNTIPREGLTHKWRMIYIVGKNCNDSCNKGLYHMRQLNIALGKNQGRFQHMMIHTDAMDNDFEQLVKTEHQAALHSYASMEALIKIFPSIETGIPPDSIYIMDPIGNIMMRFNSEISPKFILKDLNRLLKISQIG